MGFGLTPFILPLVHRPLKNTHPLQPSSNISYLFLFRLFLQSTAFRNHVLAGHQDNQLCLPFQTIFPLHLCLIFPDRESYQVDRKQAQIILLLISENI
jgi:hypothetical protein